MSCTSLPERQSEVYDGDGGWSIVKRWRACDLRFDVVVLGPIVFVLICGMIVVRLVLSNVAIDELLLDIEKRMGGHVIGLLGIEIALLGTIVMLITATVFLVAQPPFVVAGKRRRSPKAHGIDEAIWERCRSAIVWCLTAVFVSILYMLVILGNEGIRLFVAPAAVLWVIRSVFMYVGIVVVLRLLRLVLTVNDVARVVFRSVVVSKPQA